MTNLADFLLARIVEQEAALDGCQDWLECDPNSGCSAHPETGHRRAELGAVRQLVDWHRPKSSGEDYHHLCRECEWDYGDHVGMPNVWCRTLKALASPYGQHPDYKQEWRP